MIFFFGNSVFLEERGAEVLREILFLGFGESLRKGKGVIKKKFTMKSVFFKKNLVIGKERQSRICRF